MISSGIVQFIVTSFAVILLVDMFVTSGQGCVVVKDPTKTQFGMVSQGPLHSKQISTLYSVSESKFSITWKDALSSSILS